MGIGHQSALIKLGGYFSGGMGVKAAGNVVCGLCGLGCWRSRQCGHGCILQRVEPRRYGCLAAVTGLLKTAIPVAVWSLIEGVPAIWLAVFSGIAFGFYFVERKPASPLVLPLTFARSASLMVLAPVLLLSSILVSISK